MQTRVKLPSQVRGKNTANYVKWNKALNPEIFKKWERRGGLEDGEAEGTKGSLGNLGTLVSVLCLLFTLSWETAGLADVHGMKFHLVYQPFSRSLLCKERKVVREGKKERGRKPKQQASKREIFPTSLYMLSTYFLMCNLFSKPPWLTHLEFISFSHHMFTAGQQVSFASCRTLAGGIVVILKVTGGCSR